MSTQDSSTIFSLKQDSNGLVGSGSVHYVISEVRLG